jgi:DNA-directed RNA polymerase specialized sigma subunit
MTKLMEFPTLDRFVAELSGSAALKARLGVLTLLVLALPLAALRASNLSSPLVVATILLTVPIFQYCSYTLIWNRRLLAERERRSTLVSEMDRNGLLPSALLDVDDSEILVSVYRRAARNLSNYLTEIVQTPGLDIDEERELGRQIKNGDRAALRALIEANLSVVLPFMESYRECGISPLELLNEGTVGLLEAAKRFYREDSFRFSFHAPYWARQAICRALVDYPRWPRSINERLALLDRVAVARRSLLEALGQEPTVRDLANRAGVSTEQVNLLLKVATDNILAMNFFPRTAQGSGATIDDAGTVKDDAASSQSVDPLPHHPDQETSGDAPPVSSFHDDAGTPVGDGARVTEIRGMGLIEERLGKRLVRIIDPASKEGRTLLRTGKVTFVGPEGIALGRVDLNHKRRLLATRLRTLRFSEEGKRLQESLDRHNQSEVDLREIGQSMVDAGDLKGALVALKMHVELFPNDRNAEKRLRWLTSRIR